jgi:ribonuclease HI
MYVDGSVMKERDGVGLFFISSLGVRMEYMVRLHFPASNNTAEYEALINGLWIVVELGIKRLEIRGDSELVMDQVMKGEDHVWFEDRWIVASWCDQLLTTLCGLILG